jgi:hypothetical protein
MEEPLEGKGEAEREAETGVPRVSVRRGGGVSKEAGEVAGAGEAGAGAGEEAEEAEEAGNEAEGEPILEKRSISASPVSGLARHTTFTFLVRA